MILGVKYINTSNDDVSNELSNGTMGVLTSIVLLPHARIRMVALESLETLTIHAVYASEVEQFVFMHAVKDFQVEAFPSLGPGQFPVGAEKLKKKVQYRCPKAYFCACHTVPSRSGMRDDRSQAARTVAGADHSR